jgi:lipid-binding SYLF domain-containing protein
LEQEIKKATYMLYNFTSDNAMGGRDSIPRELLWGAKGLAFLTVVKAGMFVTARMGTGLVIARLEEEEEEKGEREGGMEGRRRRRRRVRWSAPSALACTGVGFGYSFGKWYVQICLCFVCVVGCFCAVIGVCARVCVCPFRFLNSLPPSFC